MSSFFHLLPFQGTCRGVILRLFALPLADFPAFCAAISLSISCALKNALDCENGEEEEEEEKDLDDDTGPVTEFRAP